MGDSGTTMDFLDRVSLYVFQISRDPQEPTRDDDDSFMERREEKYFSRISEDSDGGIEYIRSENGYEVLYFGIIGDDERLSRCFDKIP